MAKKSVAESGQQFDIKKLKKLIDDNPAQVSQTETPESFWTKFANKITSWFSGSGKDANKATGTKYGDTIDGSLYTPPSSDSSKGVVIDGGKGDDKIIGSIGNDTLLGGVGNDTLVSSKGNDVYNPGAGENVIDFNNNYVEGEASISGGQSSVILTKGSTVNMKGLQFDETGAKIFHDSSNKNDLIILDKNDNFITLKGALKNNNVTLELDGKDMSKNPLMDTVTAGEIGYYAKKTNKYTGTRLSDIIDAREITSSSGFKKGLTFDGGAGNDIIYGSSIGKGDKLSGGAGNDSVFGGAGKNILDGGAGDDYLSSDEGNDKLIGGIGNDSLFGGFGNATLVGGAGSDLLYGIKGQNILDGGAGDDSVWGGEGNDKLNGGAGNDTMFGNAGNNTIDGGAGNDFISGGIGSDSIYGGAGDDTMRGSDLGSYLNGGKGSDCIIGSIGNDTMFGGAGDDSMEGYQGNNTIDGGAGNDVLKAGSGNDVIYGGAGNDFLYGGTDNASIYGGAGNDFIYGDSGNVTVDGGAGNDFIYGGSGNASISGGVGSDTILGGEGNATIDGGAGNDLIYGSLGNTTIYGGAGNDILIGGEGNTIFKFGTNNGNDTISGIFGSTNTHTIAFDEASVVKSVNFDDKGLEIKYVDSKKKAGNITVIDYADVDNINNIKIGDKISESIQEYLTDDNTHIINSLNEKAYSKIVEYGGNDILKINAKSNDVRVLLDVEKDGNTYKPDDSKVVFVNTKVLNDADEAVSVISSLAESGSYSLGVTVINKSSGSDKGIENVQLKNTTLNTGALYDAIAQSVGAWLSSKGYNSVTAAVAAATSESFDWEGLIQAFNVSPADLVK